MADIPQELWNRVNDNRDRMIRLETNQEAMAENIKGIGTKLDCLDEKITKNIINGKVHKAIQEGKDKIQNYKIGVWGWFIRLMTAAAMTALIGGTISRILGYWR